MYSTIHADTLEDLIDKVNKSGKELVQTHCYSFFDFGYSHDYQKYEGESDCVWYAVVKDKEVNSYLDETERDPKELETVIRFNINSGVVPGALLEEYKELTGKEFKI